MPFFLPRLLPPSNLTCVLQYGGFFAPAIFAHFQRQNTLIADGSLKDSNAKALNLATVGIQNGCLDVATSGESFPEFAYKNTYGIQAYSQEIYDAARTNFTKPGGCADLIAACRAAAAEGDPLGYGNNETVNELCVGATNFCFGVVQGAYTTYSNVSQSDFFFFPSLPAFSHTDKSRFLFSAQHSTLPTWSRPHTLQSTRRHSSTVRGCNPPSASP